MKRIGLILFAILFLTLSPYSLYSVQIQDEVSLNPTDWHSMSNTIWYDGQNYLVLGNFSVYFCSHPPRPFPNYDGWKNSFFWIIIFSSDHEAIFIASNIYVFPFLFHGYCDLDKESGLIFKLGFPFLFEYHGRWDAL